MVNSAIFKVNLKKSSLDKNDLKQVLYNLVQLQSLCKEMHKSPKVSLNCVVSGVVVNDLIRLFWAAKLLEIDTLALSVFIPQPSTPDWLIPIPRLETYKLEQAQQTLTSVVELGKQNGMFIEIQPGVLDQINNELAVRKNHIKNNIPTEVEESDAPLQSTSFETPAKLVSLEQLEKLENKETRDCLDPWRFSYIMTEGVLWPCCWFHHDNGGQGLGNVHQTPYHQLINNEHGKKLRHQLLSGDLGPSCSQCSIRSWTTTKKLLHKVLNYHSFADRYFLSAINAPPLNYHEEVDYSECGNGFFFRSYGWSIADSAGTWTEGNYAGIILTLAKADNSAADVTMNLMAAGMVAKGNDSVTVNITVDGEFVGKWRMTNPPHKPKEHSMKIPADFINEDPIQIGFVIENAVSPKQLRLSHDERRFGMHVRKMFFTLASS